MFCLGAVIGTFAFLCFIVCAFVIAACDADYSRFRILPEKILVAVSEKYPDGLADYTVFAMRFEKWWQLFKIDPESFEFVDSDGARLATGKNTKQYYCVTHPCYYDKEKGIFLLISFEGLEYFKYNWNASSIADIYSARLEQGMSLAIVGDIRSKIDKIAEDANKDIQRTLDLQKEIVLRMQGEQGDQKPS